MITTAPKGATAPAADPGSLLDVRDLTVVYELSSRKVHAVTDAFLNVRPGEGVGIVGESGSGKSTFVRALMALLPGANARVASGRLRIDGEEYAMADRARMRRLRGRTMAMVFQDPLSYLNPLMTIRSQILEAVRLNDPGADEDHRVRDLLDLVRLPHRVLASYPHELSGGMRQRVLMAIALGCRPRLLIADEPTTALDVTTQAEILALLRDIMRELQMSLVLISHDLGVVSRLCDRVFVMYGGRTIETGPREAILSRPGHPYTRALVDAARSVRTADGRFVTLTGDAPKLQDGALACPFVTRCTSAMPDCSAAVPGLFPVGETGRAAAGGHLVRCLLHDAAAH
ncbi:ABC transporter ATP-binding protein (plasmid) [Tistrella mobilis]|uniref:ABC transporter ATP-binding protein n=1 Tax=Tistrella mobilis TaxID=171437 RepID=UPI003558E130